MIKETFYTDSGHKVSITYTVDPPEPDVGVMGGVVLHSCVVLSGPEVDDMESLEASIVSELKRDLE